MLETLDHTIRIGSTPTFLYFDIYNIGGKLPIEIVQQITETFGAKAIHQNKVNFHTP